MMSSMTGLTQSRYSIGSGFDIWLFFYLGICCIGDAVSSTVYKEVAVPLPIATNVTRMMDSA